MPDADERCPACGKTTLRFFHKVGKYRCIDDDCGAEFLPDQLQAASSVGAEALNLDTLPFPIAYPLAHARDERLPARDRVANAIFAGYQAMRTTALLLFADYLACETVCHELQKPIRGLRLPHWYEWNVLCDQLSKFWSGHLQERPERSSVFPGLVAAWLEVNRHKKLPLQHPWSELLAGLPGVDGPARSLNDALWKARNDLAHRETTRTLEDGEERDLMPRLIAITETMAQRLFPAGELTLWRRIGAEPDQPTAIRLHGPHTDLRFDIEGGPQVVALAWANSELLASTTETDVPVYPLFVPLDTEGAGQKLPGGGLIEPVGLVESIDKKKIAVLGVRQYFERPELLNPVQESLDRKAIELGVEREETQRWNLVSWAAVAADDTLMALRGRKYFPEFYLERSGIDGLVREVLKQPHRGLLLLGEAGSGKSSLLARLVDEILADAPDQVWPAHQSQSDALDYLDRRGSGDVVLFLSGADAYRGDAAWSGRQALCEAVLRRAGIKSGAFSDLDDLCRHLNTSAAKDQDADRRIWLIFDALNEADRFTDLLKALDDVLPALQRYSWLRLAVSLRTGAYQSLAQRHRDLLQHGSEVLANARFLASFSDQQHNEVPYLELDPFAVAEAREAYQLRQQRRPGQSCPVPFDKLAPSLRELVRAPLYLHLFHETFHGRTTAPSELDEGRLLSAYLDRLQADQPGIAEYLQRLGVLMFEQRIPFLPIQEADAWIAEWRARLGVDNALRVVKLDPVEELVAVSLLMRPIEMGRGGERHLAGYGFSHQRLCEQLLLRELMRQIHPRTLPTAEDLLAWARQANGPDATRSDGFNELTGALESLTATLAEQGQGEVLAALLELEGKAVRNRLLGNALKALGPFGRTDADHCKLVLTPLIRRAIIAGSIGEYFEDPACEAQTWLKRHGFSAAARQLAAGRLEVMRALVAKEPERTDLCEALSMSLDDIGLLHNEAGDSAAARAFFDESLEINRALLALNPQQTDLRRKLAVSLDHQGQVAEAAGDVAAARAFFYESLEITRVLLKQEPESTNLTSDLSISLDNLGRLAQATGDGVTARSYFTESLEISRALVAQEPDLVDSLVGLSASLDKLANLAESMGDGPTALSYREESLEIDRRLVAQEPGCVDLRHNLSLSLTSLGRLAENLGARDSARAYFEESAQIMFSLVTEEPELVAMSHDLTLSLDALGDLAEEEGDVARARSYYKESLEILRALVAQEPGRADLRLSLSVSLDQLGWLAEVIDDSFAHARNYYKESLEIRRALVAQEPDGSDLRDHLANSLDNLGRLAEQWGGSAEIHRCFEKSLEIRRGLVAQEPARMDLRRALSVALHNLGRVAKVEGNRKKARSYFDESVEIRRALVVQWPERADLQVDLASSYWYQYEVAAGRDERVWLERVIETLKPLRDAGLKHELLNILWDDATNALRRCSPFWRAKRQRGVVKLDHELLQSTLGRE
ncbi:tetratricopeptide repeat protein [Thiorhodococcus mannitoliphagus]|uniref:Tetratricopeptide repeat protein n=1 Tax=Thiorhodococcus mannitoliphagus TaxID=329406 RepID=A0A6P1E0T9_9GAMM|nr:tetratricopeptide repeat protein [Thiorhodococcus mannitoliphagus]NEX22931.1 tetratricopeptide repeat protein [Thiorhodococcus mannitoliphagus]